MTAEIIAIAAMAQFTLMATTYLGPRGCLRIVSKSNLLATYLHLHYTCRMHR